MQKLTIFRGYFQCVHEMVTGMVVCTLSLSVLSLFKDYQANKCIVVKFKWYSGNSTVLFFWFTYNNSKVQLEIIYYF